MKGLKATFFLTFLFVFLFSIVSVNAAVGVSPGTYTVNYVPNLKQHFAFDFLGDSNMELEIYASGDLAQYVKLDKKRITGNGGVGVDISLPSSIETPGTHEIYIGARQVVKDGETQGFGIIGNVKGVINVVVPYPGQYVLFDLTATNANAQEPVNLTATFNNLGIEAVEAYGDIKIYNSEKYVSTVDFGSFDLASPEKKVILKTLDTTGYSSGNYLAIGSFRYGDNKVVEANTTFKLGELFLSIINYTKILERNKINRFEIQVESQWNNPISGVYANVTVQGYPINFLTPTANLDRFGTTVLTGFFDTTNIVEDTFNANVELHYDGKSSQEVVTLSFKKETDYLMIGLIAGVIFLIILVIIVTLLLRRADKKNKK
ncbi:MAG TPA: hypothetical protein VHA12_03560 [Candidatus Nanoarchaeia archaeon]|nr:hypothetical protein [Candidatus Nanoarchaeia archaeon]